MTHVLFKGYGFNPGSAALLTATQRTGLVAALAATNTSLAAASGAISALFTNLYLQERRTGEYQFDITMAMNGALSGLVAITAPCGTVEPWGAVATGFVSGWVYIVTSKLLLRLRLDDAVDAIPVHMFNGMWGLIAVGLFSSPRHTLEAFGSDDHVGWFYSLGNGSFDATLLLNQLFALLFILGWTTATMAPFFLLLNYMGWFRADSLEELVGLDISYHGGRHAAEDEVKQEDISAYKRKKASHRRSSLNRSTESIADEQSWTDMTASAPPEGRRDAFETNSEEGMSKESDYS